MRAWADNRLALVLLLRLPFPLASDLLSMCSVLDASHVFAFLFLVYLR